jgi:hypothetical protein
VKSSFEASLDLKACKHYSCSGPFNAPVAEELCTGTDWYHWNIQKSELYYPSPSKCMLCSRIIFETKSGVESTNNVTASGLSAGPVTDELGTGTDWYHWNLQESAENLNK